MSAGAATEVVATEVAEFAREDVAEGARILFEAFRDLYEYHRFPGAYPSPEFAAQIIHGLVEHPSIWGVVARAQGRVLGSSFIDERGSIKGVGPVSVDPRSQTRGVGRLLTQALIEHAGEAHGIRLLQDSFNRSSLALYASLGFEVREPIVLLAGRPRSGSAPRAEVRRLQEGDVTDCERLCMAVHGFERSNELRDALRDPLCAPLLAVRDGRVTAYATTLNYFPAAHAVAATEEDMRDLILGGAARGEQSLSFLLPTHQGSLFRWCLGERLRVIKPMTYMTIGDYSRPRGCWIPSLMY